MSERPAGWASAPLGPATPGLDSFTTERFTHDGATREVHHLGEGPGVIVMAEMPGITPGVVDFARRVTGIGCSVWVPQLFGEPGRPPGVGAFARSLVPACVSREFAAFAAGSTAPVTVWLRALAAAVHERAGGPGVGAIGMCFTGGFALALAVDDVLVAPVLSQPSLPLAVSRAHRSDLHLSPGDLATVKARAAQGLCVLGMRFTGDRLVPAERFTRLRDELGDAFVAVEIDSSRGNPHGIPANAHSVVTEHLVDEPGHPTRDALEQVLDLFRARLLSGPAGC